MKIELENDDIESIASTVVDRLKPLLTLRDTTYHLDTIMDVQDLAGYLKVEPTWVYKQIQYKTIPHFKAGRYPRFRRKEIEAWIRFQAVPTTAPPYPALKGT